MLQVCIFSGHEGRIRPRKTIYLTLFAGCTLVRPTFAQQMIVQRARDNDRQGPPEWHYFFTMFGGVSIKSPTLVEEYMDLHKLILANAITRQDCERFVMDPARAEIPMFPITLFGGFDECELPAESAEIESIALHLHLGNLSESAGQTLQMGIGQRDAERRATVQRAVTVAA